MSIGLTASKMHEVVHICVCLFPAPGPGSVTPETGNGEPENWRRVEIVWIVMETEYRLYTFASTLCRCSSPSYIVDAWKMDTCCV
jgi:hypothetical protein